MTRISRKSVQKQFATKSQRHKDIIFDFFLRALVSWWQVEKSFAIINTNSRIKILWIK